MNSEKGTLSGSQDLSAEDVRTLRRELENEDLQVYTVVRLAQRDLEAGDVETAIARLRVDADKLRNHDTKITRLLAQR